MIEKAHRPVSINLHKKSRILEISFDEGSTFELSCEMLRVFSPSAEVSGHGPGQAVLQLDKEEVNITDIEPVGNYAIKLVFDDGHHTGLYTWDYLYDLGNKKDGYWQEYLQALKDAGYKRKSI